MNKDTVRHVSGDHICWTRTLENGDILLYTRDKKLKQEICMTSPKWIDIITNPFDDETIPVCNGDALMIAILSYGHCLLAIDNELEGFTLLTSNRVGKFKT